MEHTLCIDTAKTAADRSLSVVDDEFLASETPVTHSAPSDPLLQHLPFEGYRILDAQSSRPSPIKVRTRVALPQN